MDADVAGGSAMVRRDYRSGNLAEEHIKHAVIAAYLNAPKGPEDMWRSAFNAALRVYRERHPGISEGLARHQVARIICFADR